MKIIVGLGNPKESYAGTRHNLGFELVDRIADRQQATGNSWEDSKKFKAQFAKVSKDLLLVKPQTYMNNSGMAVKLVADYYKVAPEDIVIIHDELDLPLGKIKVRQGGAAAGHHGVESIIGALGTDQFVRVRLGIGNLKTQSGEHKHASISAEKFVLEPFLHSEHAQVKHMLKQAIKAVEILLEKGLPVAQNQFN